MTFERGNSAMRRLKSGAFAVGLGLASLLSAVPNSSSAAEKELKPTFGGIGYKEQARSMSSDEVIRSVSTPEEAKFYRDNCITYEHDIKNYGVGEHYASFKQIHEKGSDDCDGVAFAMAALLQDDGYPAEVLKLRKKITPIELAMTGRKLTKAEENDPYDYHVVYPYKDKESGKWGIIGVNRREDISAKYNSIEDATEALRKQSRFRGYEVNDSKFKGGIQDLAKSYGIKQLTSGEGNLAKIPSSYNGVYNSRAYGLIRDTMRKEGFKGVDREKLVNEVVENRWCSYNDAEKMFDNAYRNAESEFKHLVADYRK